MAPVRVIAHTPGSPATRTASRAAAINAPALARHSGEFVIGVGIGDDPGAGLHVHHPVLSPPRCAERCTIIEAAIGREIAHPAGA